MIIGCMSCLRVLGCAGGVGGGRQSTCFLLDGVTLIDAGSGLFSLSLDELGAIQTIVLTHSHLDHVLAIPLLLDAVAASRKSPLTVYGLPQTLAALSQHFFNGQIWPTLDELSREGRPAVLLKEVALGERVLADRITVLPAHHAIAACGYAIAGDSGTLIFTGDTRAGDAFWQAANRFSDLTHLIIETSYLNADRELARQAYHLTAHDLAAQLGELRLNPEIFITHLKPGFESGIMEEVFKSLGGQRKVSALCQGAAIDF